MNNKITFEQFCIKHYVQDTELANFIRFLSGKQYNDKTYEHWSKLYRQFRLKEGKRE